MLTFFIVIVLISEVIVTANIIAFILKIDKKVCDLNKQIEMINPVVENCFTKLRIAINKMLLSLNKFEQKLQSKKEEFKFKLLKNIITTAIFLILNTNGKKVISVVGLAFDLKNIIQKCSKVLV